MVGLLEVSVLAACKNDEYDLASFAVDILFFYERVDSTQYGYCALLEVKRIEISVLSIISVTVLFTVPYC